jgi:transposase
MTKITQTLDFKNQLLSIGIDVHLKSWHVSLYYGSMYLKSFTQPPCADALSSYLHTHYPNAQYQCAYESGFCGFWIQRALTAKNINCIVVNAADVPQTDKGNKNKNDKNDSKRIALALQAGQLNGISIPDEELEADRQLVRCNEKYNNDLTRIKNRIKGLLYLFGIELPEQFKGTIWSNLFVQWLKELSFKNNSLRVALDNHLFSLEITREQKLKTLKNMRLLLQKERYHTIAKNILSIPGIGPITAACLITEIGDIRRFNSFNHFNSFVGFCPMQFSSGAYDYKGRITIRQNKKLRYLLIEAAWTVVRKDPTFTLCFNEWKNKIGAKRAIIKVARKLLSRIRYVLLNEKEYVNAVIK